MKFYYAMYDWTVRESNPGRGFANTKSAIAFTSKKERDAFVKERSWYDYATVIISRRQALKMLESLPYAFERGLKLNDINGMYSVVLRVNPNFINHNVGDIVVA